MTSDEHSEPRSRICGPEELQAFWVREIADLTLGEEAAWSDFLELCRRTSAELEASGEGEVLVWKPEPHSVCCFAWQSWCEQEWNWVSSRISPQEPDLISSVGRQVGARSAPIGTPPSHYFPRTFNMGSRSPAGPRFGACPHHSPVHTVGEALLPLIVV
jgi:hypothetical protein